MKPDDTPESGDLTSIADACELLDLDFSPTQLQSLERYRTLLVEANQLLNLTSITEPKQVDSRLIAESLAIVPLIEGGELRILDIGTGGGIPGLPLAIALPDAELHLLDATAKKLTALREIAEELQLDNVRFTHGRAEDVGHDADHRGCYTHVVARAVARLPTLVELALPFLKPGGIAIFPKGRQVQDELHEAQKAISTLGGRLIDVFASPVNDARLVRVELAHPSPPEYPRKPGIPSRQPIGVPAR